MSTKRRKLWILVAILVSIALAAFLPLVEHLPHPETVTVQIEEGLQLPLNLSVVWYDLGARPCRTRRSSEREPADSHRDIPNVIGGWLSSLTFALGNQDEFAD